MKYCRLLFLFIFFQKFDYCYSNNDPKKIASSHRDTIPATQLSVKSSTEKSNSVRLIQKAKTSDSVLPASSSNSNQTPASKTASSREKINLPATATATANKEFKNNTTSGTTNSNISNSQIDKKASTSNSFEIASKKADLKGVSVINNTIHQKNHLPIVKSELTKTDNKNRTVALSDQNPNYANSNGNKKATTLPSKFKLADFNNNQLVEIDEVYQTIDKYFEDSINVSTETIYDLIDYFFEQ